MTLTTTDKGPWLRRLLCWLLGHQWRVVRWTVLVHRDRCVRCGTTRTTFLETHT